MTHNLETIEKIGFGEMKLIQSGEGFRFGVDAVILADFANRFCSSAGQIADLGTGNGIIPFILCHKNPKCHVRGFDIQQEAIDMAVRSCDMNSMNDRIDFIKCDVKDIISSHPELKAAMDVVVSNPPYVAKGRGIKNEADGLLTARQETTADLEDFISTAAKLLRERGHLFMVHRPSRLVDIFYLARKYRLEPKDIRLVTPSEGKKANIVLVHCVLGGGHELNILDELPVHDSQGGYTAEILSIYEKTG